MKIVFVKKLYSPIGGSEALTYQWARRLAGRGHDVRVLSLWPVYRRHGYPPAGHPIETGKHYRAFLDGGVKVYQLAPYGGTAGKVMDVLPVFALVRKALGVALAAGGDIVHNVCREYTGAAHELARRAKAPLVLTPLPHPGQPFSGASGRDIATYRQADGIVAMTEHEKRWYESRGVPGERVAAIGSGSAVRPDGDGDSFRARLGLSGPMVLFVGRQEAYKGYLTVADAARAVWAEHPETHFVFIGEKSWSSRFYDPLRRRHDRRIVDLKVVDEGEKAAAYAACDVFCMPSRHETLGLTYLEAWQYGKPVIGGDITPLREVIDDGLNGLLVAPEAAAVARAINKLLDNPALAREMGTAGRRKAAERYNWEVVIERLEGFYRQLIAAQRPTCGQHP